MLLTIGLGAVFSFVATLPVTGPATALIADAALRGERGRAFAIGVGAAAAESVWAGLALLGGGAVYSSSTAARMAAELVAGVVLVVAAVLLWRSPQNPADTPRPPGGRSLLVGLSATGLNPTLFITWTTIGTTLLGMGAAVATPTGALALAAGVFLGAAAGVVVLALARAGRRLGAGGVIWMSRAVSALLFALAIGAFVRAIGES